MGTDITYECTGSCTYRVYLKVYYDCTGGAWSSQVPVSANQGPNAPTPPGSLDLVPEGGCASPVPTNTFTQSYQEVTPICPALLNPPPGVPYPTGCENTTNPSINGVAEAIYVYDYDLCSFACDSVTLEFSNCARNDIITSIGGVSKGCLYVGTAGIDLTSTTCNNSPVFQDPITGASLPPIAYICAGETTTFNQGAFDPDGDSLAYRFTNCLQGNSNLVNYNPGYGPQAPLGPTWDVQIDPITGDISFNPSPTGAVEVGVICIIVEEWRNGELIGEITRDMQVTVLANCSSSTPLTSGITNLTLGPDQVPATPISYNEVRTCAGTNVCFELPTISQDPNLTYTMRWNQAIPGATFTDATNPAISDTVTGPAPTARFCWTPPVGTRGTYFFLVTLQDDACPIPGTNQFTIIIYVEDGLANTQIVTDTVGCNDINLAYLLDPIVPGQYSSVITSVQWTGNGNLQYNPNTTDSSFVHTYPAPGNYFVNLVLQDTFGCRSEVPGVVNVPYGAIADAGPDVTLCANDQFQMGTTAIPGQTYQWTPATNLSSATSAEPLFSLPPGPIVQDSFFYTVTVSDGICTTFDYTKVLINPSLDIDIAPANPTICIGDSVTLRASGTLQTDYQFLWSTGDTLDSIRVAPNTSQSYSVVAFNDGCSSSSQVTVNVQVGPQASITGDTEACPNGTITLQGAGGDSYLWSAGNFSGQSVTLSGITGDSTVYLTAFDDAGCPGPMDSVTLSPLPIPTVGFSADLVCEGSPTQFTDTSSVPGGNIVAWSWDFNDGTGTIGAAPKHTFSQPGVYNISLEATSDRGCRNTAVQQIEVNAAPTVDFTVEEVCEGSPSPFNDATTVEPGTELDTYSWTFGDGANFTGNPNTSHVYKTYGNYNVTLRVTTLEGCVDSFTRTTFVHPNPVSDFTFEEVCEGRNVRFTSLASTAGDRDYVAEWAWDFGQDPADPGNFSTEANPRRFYDSTGVYLVNLAVVSNNGCVDDTTIAMTVYETPVADFTYDQTCDNVQTVYTQTATTNPATPIDSYFWDLGDSSTIAEGPTARITYGIGNYGTYPVTLIVGSNVGCTDTITKDVFINPSPAPRFSALPVCLLDSTNFRDSTTLSRGSITERRWEFGDGRITFGFNPTHEYRTDGSYSVRLTATSDSGCVRSTQRNVVVHPIPELLQLREDSVCFGNPAAIYAVSTEGVKVNWYYNENDTMPFHVGNAFLTDPLPVSTTYYVEPESRFGCKDDRTAIIATVYEGADMELVISDEKVEAPGAIVEFKVASTLPISAYTWSFGDGTANQTGPNPVYEYQYPGKYVVRVNTVDQWGCEASLNGLVEVTQLVDIFTPTAFTPNGDNNNDTYRISYVNIRDFQIQIFNRWGQLVFESDNPDFEWDGVNTKNMRPVGEGVYVAVIKAHDLDGNDIEESRTITVFR